MFAVCIEASHLRGMGHLFRALNLTAYFRQKNEPFVVYNLSDEIKNIRPYIEVRFEEAGDFILINTMDNLSTEVKNVSENEVITFYGRYENIISSLPEHIVADDFNYHYPIIGNTKNSNINKYTTNLNCEITIKYSPIIKVGM